MGRLRNGVGIGISNIPTLSSRRPAFSPLSLFSDGSQGVWYDDSLTSSMFQDSAGATPVTAVEQPVGKQLDLSGNGNHRTQTTAAYRPILSARYNLLTKTEQFDNATWTKSAATVTADSTVAPDGTTTADTLTDNATSTYHRVERANFGSTGASWSYSVYAKNIDIGYVSIGGYTSGSIYVGVSFNLTTEAVSNTQALGGIAIVSSNIVNVGNGWYRCEIVCTGSVNFVTVALTPDGTLTDRGMKSYSGTGSSLYIWGADLRPANQATGLIPTYQRVDTSSVYDTVGFPQYIKYNGLDQFLSTASIDFTATAQMSVFSGLRKLSDAAAGYAIELSVNSTSNSGAFYLSAPNSAAANFGAGSGGTTFVSGASASSFAAPTTQTAQILANISAPSLDLYLNNTSVLSSTSTQGTGNYGNYAMYFGRRAGTSSPFNGYEFQTIIVGKTLTATEITNTETYVNSKTKAY